MFRRQISSPTANDGPDERVPLAELVAELVELYRFQLAVRPSTPPLQTEKRCILGANYMTKLVHFWPWILARTPNGCISRFHVSQGPILATDVLMSRLR